MLCWILALTRMWNGPGDLNTFIKYRSPSNVFLPHYVFPYMVKGLFFPFHSWRLLSEIELKKKKKTPFSMLLVSVEYLVLIKRIRYSLEFLWLQKQFPMWPFLEFLKIRPLILLFILWNHLYLHCNSSISRIIYFYVLHTY